MNRKLCLFLVVTGFLLTSCSALPFSRPAISPTPYSSLTPVPSQIPTLTQTAVPTLIRTPTPINVAQLGQSLPVDPQRMTAANGSQLQLLAHWGRGIPQAAAWNAESNQFAVATTHGVYVFGGDTLTQLSAPDSHSPFRSLVYTPHQSSRIAAGTEDGNILIWNIDELVNKFTAHTGPVLALTYSPDGNLLASGGWDGKVNIWDTITGNLLRTIVGDVPVYALAFTPDGKGLAAWSSDNQPVVWSLEGKQKDRPLFIGTNAKGRSATNAAFSPDGAFLAANQEYRVRVQRTGDGTTLVTLNTFQKPVLRVAVANGGGAVATLDSDSLDIWDSRTRKIIQSFALPADERLIRLLAFSHDGSSLLALGERLHVFLLNSQNEIHPPGPVMFPPNFTLAAKMDEQDGDLRIMRIDGWLDKLSLKDGQVAFIKRLVAEVPNQVAFSKDGYTFAAALANKKIILGDVNNNAQKILSAQKQMPSRLAFSPDGRVLASTSAEKNVNVWDITTGKLITHLQMPEVPFGLAFSPQGELLAVGLPAQTILVRTSDWTSVDTLEGSAPHFSPDGVKIALAVHTDNGPGIQIYTVGGKADLPLMQAEGQNMAFSPDGSLLAVSGRKITLWNTLTGEQLFSAVNAAPYGQVFFTADGSSLGLLTWDGVVYLYGVP